MEFIFHKYFLYIYLQYISPWAVSFELHCPLRHVDLLPRLPTKLILAGDKDKRHVDVPPITTNELPGSRPP